MNEPFYMRRERGAAQCKDCVCVCVSRSVVSDSLRLHGR